MIAHDTIVGKCLIQLKLISVGKFLGVQLHSRPGAVCTFLLANFLNINFIFSIFLPNNIF